MLTVIDQKIESAYRCSLRWKCTTKGVLYFRVYRGLNPKDKTLLAQTTDVTIGNVSLNTPADGGDVYICIEGIDSDDKILDTLSFRITPGDVSTYLKYRKYFEDNLYRAALQKASGTFVAILQRKFTGDRCPDCANKYTGEPEDSNCKTCFGTGYVGGFYTPIITPASRGAGSEQSYSTGESTQLRMLQTGIIVPAYPRLYPNDYIVDLQDYTFYEIVDQGFQVMQHDHQRLGSTAYQTKRLPEKHPVVKNYEIDKVLTNIHTVSINGDNILSIRGVKVKPSFGRLSVVVYNKDHEALFTVDEEVYFFTDMYTIKDEEIQFKIDPRFRDLNCGYKITLNNRYFEGDISNE